MSGAGAGGTGRREVEEGQGGERGMGEEGARALSQLTKVGRLSDNFNMVARCGPAQTQQRHGSTIAQRSAA